MFCLLFPGPLMNRLKPFSNDIREIRWLRGKDVCVVVDYANTVVNDYADTVWRCQWLRRHDNDYVDTDNKFWRFLAIPCTTLCNRISRNHENEKVCQTVLACYMGPRWSLLRDQSGSKISWHCPFTNHFLRMCIGSASVPPVRIPHILYCSDPKPWPAA